MAAARYEHLKGRSFAHFAFHFNPTLVLFDDAINCGQPQAGAFPHLLGGKKWFKDAAQVLRSDTAAVVGCRQRNEPASAGPRMLSKVAGVQVLDGDFNRELAAAGHSVPRVDRQVQEDLFHHASIGFDQRRLGKVIELQRDILAEDARQHFGHVADHFIEVQALGLHDLAAAEGEQLAGEGCGALADLLGGPDGHSGQIAARQQERGVAVDNGEDVVEIMSDAAGQLADGVHLLGLAQLVLQPFLARDIPEQSQQQRRLAPQLDEGGGILESDDVPVGQRQSAFDRLFHHPLEESLAVVIELLLPLLGVCDDDGEWVSFQLFAAHPDQIAKGLVDGHNVALLIGQAHAINRILPDRVEEHLRTAQSRLRQLALGNVAHVQQHSRLAAVFDAIGTHLDRNDAAIECLADALDLAEFAFDHGFEIASDLLLQFRRDQI